ncbi:hypothetical protein CPB83DRAFT_861151 [Crepidotus variabilis]|uniref:Uncharacterized protein n=1 Tax=Crepidotus variabilis TaxID=179855 RepID=A0A9P6E8N3_9AGAR|nr:hypothetical protein CPB83DRAFT_861151 [Crepidotus variabilis]
MGDTKSITKPSQKRRKLFVDPTSGTELPPFVNDMRILTTTTNCAKRPASLVCISCNRFLALQGSILRCAICNSTTCPVCSRTCMAGAAEGPTPHSPLPPTSLDPHSPVGEVHNTEIENLTRPQRTLAGRRRKLVENESDQRSALPAGSYALKHSAGRCDWGCGRTLCRNCCNEDVLSDTTICSDCQPKSTS